LFFIYKNALIDSTTLYLKYDFANYAAAMCAFTYALKACPSIAPSGLREYLAIPGFALATVSADKLSDLNTQSGDLPSDIGKNVTLYKSSTEFSLHAYGLK